MNNWKQKQDGCKKCGGYGYLVSEMRHPDWHTPHAWAVRCECQPSTVLELEEAAAQEQQDAPEPPKDVQEKKWVTCAKCNGTGRGSGCFEQGGWIAGLCSECCGHAGWYRTEPPK